MSILNCTLAFEEIKEPEDKVLDLLSMRHLSISNNSTDAQPTHQVVKVRGNITVSF